MATARDTRQLPDIARFYESTMPCTTTGVVCGGPVDDHAREVFVAARAARPAEEAFSDITAPSVPEQIAFVRGALSLQMNELARAMGVERPTVYSWLNERNLPRDANRRRLVDLYRIAWHWTRLSPLPLAEKLHEVDMRGISVLSLLAETPLPIELLQDRFDEAAKRGVSKKRSSHPSARESALRHKIDLARVGDRQDDIDLETGKGYSLE